MRRNGRKAARRAKKIGQHAKALKRAGRGGAIAQATRPVVDALEPRILFCGPEVADQFGSTAVFRPNGLTDNWLFYQDVGPRIPKLQAGLAYGSLGTVPTLNSKADAPATIYLDFDGDVAQTWGSFSVPTTPAFDQNGDVTTFSDTEITAIRQIWSRVAEAYSPFNINVTTVDPGTLVDGQSMKIVIGGAGAWLGSAAGGVAYVGAFANSAPNVVWVFTANLGSGNVKYTSDGAIHESGHAMALQHQSQYSGTTKTAEYRQGDSLTAPYMGVSYYSQRGKWSNGQSALGYNRLQDDMAVIAANSFGYRADDHADTLGAADALTVSGNTVSGSGVIEKTTDLDVFSFTTLQGPVSFTVNPNAYGGMLDATMTLMDVNGGIVATANTTSLAEVINTTVAGGSYRLVISSKGVYGDVGQYTITGTIVNDADSVAAPSNLAASSAANGVSLTWYDNAWNETGFVIERSDDGGTTWNDLTTLSAEATAYTDTTAQVGSSYKYRIYATGDMQDSAASNVATISVVPGVPGGLVATSASASSITLTWTDVTGETGYVIDRSINGSTWAQVATPSADATTWSDSGLAAAAKYYYRLKSAGATGNSPVTSTVSATTRPATPALTLTVGSSTSITLLWTNVAGETGYRLERSADGQSGWATLASPAANVATYTNTGLTANTAYYYRVVATSAAGESGAGSANATTLLGAPSGLTASATSATAIHLAWTDMTGETGYRIERTVDAKTWLVAANVDADTATYDATGLTPGTTYTWRLKALNAGGLSAAGTSASATTIPPAPVLTASAASNTQLNLTWTNVSGETSYLLERSADGQSGWSTIAAPGANVVAYNNSGLTPDTVYYYRITARNAAGDSAASTVVSGRTLLTAPTGLLATGVSTTQIDLAWTDAAGESSYVLERSPNGSTLWSTRATPVADATSYSDTGLTAGTIYYYRLRAVNASGNSFASSSASTFTIPAMAGLSVAALSASQIKLTWTNVSGETGYKIERSADGQADWTLLSTAAANAITYTDSALAENTSYFYRVTAANNSGNAAASEVKSTKTLIAAPSGLAAVAASTTAINLSWTDSAGESSYVVERSPNGSTLWTSRATPAADAVSYSETGLIAGTVYYYRLRAVNSSGSSFASSTASTFTIPATTALTVLATSATQIKLTWTNVSGETGYKIERSADGQSDWALITTTAANAITYTDSGLTANTPYYYRVTPTNASGDAAASEVKTTRTLITSPSGLAAVAVSTSEVDLTWTDSTGETGYVIERSVNGVNWSQIAIVDADDVDYANTGLVAGTAYLYRVKAINAGGNSAASSTSTATTVPATPSVTATVVAATQINLAWTNVTGETGYRVEQSNDGTNWTTIATKSVNIATHQAVGLTADTLYYFRVTPFNVAGEATGTTVSKRTVLSPPSGLAATALTTTSVRLTWNDSGEESAYKVERYNGRSWLQIATVEANTTTYTNTGLTANVSYQYRIRATNAAGDSGVSAGVSVTTTVASARRGRRARG